jgi:hypothetical protein
MEHIEHSTRLKTRLKQMARITRTARLAQITRTAGLVAIALSGSFCLQFSCSSTARAEPYDGYTLFSINNSNRSYMVDMTNTVVHSWTHNRTGGYCVYLLNNGDILRPAESTGSPLNGGGAAGIVQEVAPNSTVVWQYTYSSATYRTHHDIEPLPNGNVLLIAWELKTAAEAIQAGLNHSAQMWPDHIIEVHPTGSTTGEIVWVWHAWDHLIQDYNPAKDNYGVVGEHPELIDINLGGGGMGGGDWMHTNGISYNPEWDQIVISCHNLNEIYVIDHSTTSAEAASHSGGRSGKGGDILYRWGNPSNYDAPGAQYFRVVHCAYWVPAGLPGAHDIMAFNNRDGLGTSIVAELVPPADGEGFYTPLVPGTAYGPAAPVWTYTATGFYSNHLGGCERLPNGNTFIVESMSGYMFEVNSGGTTLWSYDRSDEIARALRYGMNHPGLVGLGLTTSAQGEENPPVRLALAEGPNPFSGSTTIRYELPADGHISLRIYDLLGREVATLVDGLESAGSSTRVFDAGGLAGGIYFCRLQHGGATCERRLVLLR